LASNACKEDYYEVNDAFYNGMVIEVKNPLVEDTLRIELYSTDQLTIEAVSNPDINFDPRAFIYTAEHDSVLTVSDDGMIQPLSRGVSRISIAFRANSTLNTSVVVAVHKDYHPVQELQVPAAIEDVLVELEYTVDLKPYIILKPVYADNRQLHFSFNEAASQGRAEVSDEGLVTGKEVGEISVLVVADDNPELTVDVRLSVVSEIEITDVKLHSNLDNVTLGIGESVDLNEVTSVTPASVNPTNRKLKFTLNDGAGVVRLDNNGLLTATSAGTAHLTATSKNGISKTFAVNVDADKTDLTRSFWTVETSALYANGNNYVVDGTTGKPEHILDNDAATFLSLTKPGKTINNCAAPAGVNNYIIVDMKSVSKFKSIRWNHRANNSYTYLRVWGIDLAGSLDGETWNVIQEAIPLPNTHGAANGNDNDRHDIPLNSEHEYRYVKVTFTQWSDNSEGGAKSGNTMQIAEFGLSR
jgi:hypothetical protein